MKVWEIFLIIAIAVAFIAAMVITVYGKIKHKSGCDCGGHCGGCAGCGHAQPRAESKSCPHCAQAEIPAENKHR